MKVSVIIPSYNPSLKLPETLRALAGQRGLINELILVVDRANFNKMPDGLLEKYGNIFNLIVIEQTDSGRGKSRNKGAEASSGDLLIFLDDDMLAEKDLIEKHIQNHIRLGEIILTGNGYRKPDEANTFFGKYLVNMENKWIEEGNKTGNVTLEKFIFTACNMSAPRNLFFQLQGFDTRFTDGEDFDFAVRAIMAGKRVYYDNSLVAWHNDWPGVKTFMSRQVEYNKAKKDIFNAHPDYLSHFSHMVPVRKGILKRMIASVFNIPLTWFVNPKEYYFCKPSLKNEVYAL